MSDADDFMTRYLNNITSQYESIQAGIRAGRA